MYKGHRVIALIPTYNNEGLVGRFLRKIPHDHVDEIVVVNDGSKDNTLAEVQSVPNITIINFPHNKGLGIGFKTMFAYALKHNYDIAVIMGGDDQDDPTQIKQMLEKLVDEKYDLVQGSRYLGQSLKIPLSRRLTTILYSLVFSLAVKKRVTDASNGFKTFSLPILNHIPLTAKWLEDKYGIEQYLLAQAIRKGFRVTEIPVRKFFPKGFSKMNLFTDWHLLLRPLWHSLATRRRR